MIKKDKRDVRYEIIRVVAMFFVIALHNIGSMNSSTDTRLFFQYLFNLIFFTSNGMFFMMSGKFSLSFDREKPHSYRNYYYKKLLNFIMPMLIYMFIRTLIDTDLSIGIISIVKVYIKNVMSGYWSSEYWFLYVLLGNIIVAPLLANGFKQMTDKELWLFIILGLTYNSISAYAPLIVDGFSWQYPFASCSFYFYMGYCIDRLTKERKQSIRFLPIGILCIIITLLQNYYGKVSGVYDIAPTYAFLCIAMFFLLRDFISVKRELTKKIIFFIGKYSFSIYLVHSVILNNVVKEIYPFKSDMLFIPYLFLIAVITMIICLLVCFVIDNTLLFGIRYIINKLWNKFKQS